MATKKLFFIRHAESEKNLGEKFDGDPSLDRLTRNGMQATIQIAELLQPIIKGMSVKFFCANSGRARETCEILSGDNGKNPEVIDELGSMKSGPFSGMDDVELFAKYPAFFHELQLFRAGVMSGYSLNAPKGAEKWEIFEEKINLAIDRIDNDPSDLKVVVCHRSAMIALLNRFARLYLNCPPSHLGFANVPPLFSALIRPSNPRNAFLVGPFGQLFNYLRDDLV